MRCTGTPVLNEWQLFLRALSACDYDVVRWVEGQEPWEELVEVIAKVLERARRGLCPPWPPR